MKRTLLDWLFLEQELYEDLRELKKDIEYQNIIKEGRGEALQSSPELFFHNIKNLAEVCKVIIHESKKSWMDFEIWIQVVENFKKYSFDQLIGIIERNADDCNYNIIYEVITLGGIENIEMPDSQLFEETEWTNTRTQNLFPHLFNHPSSRDNLKSPIQSSMPIIGAFNSRDSENYDWPYLNLLLNKVGDSKITDLNTFLSIKTKQWLIDFISKESRHNWDFYYLSRSSKIYYLELAVAYEIGEFHEEGYVLTEDGFIPR